MRRWADLVEGTNRRTEAKEVNQGKPGERARGTETSEEVRNISAGTEERGEEGGEGSDQVIREIGLDEDFSKFDSK